MKKIILLFVLGIFSLSCSSDTSSEPDLADVPEAKSIYDNSSFGIYKGVFVGSSGTVYINILNEDALTATVTINNSSKTYTSNAKIAEGDAIEALTFSNGADSFKFNVNGDGDNPSVSNISISGHPNAKMAVLKEYSNSLCKCYVGTFTGDDEGVFNFVKEGSIIDGWGKSNDGVSFFNFDGSAGENALWGTFEGGVFSGSFNGDNVSGGWSNDADETGGWSGKRKL